MKFTLLAVIVLAASLGQVMLKLAVGGRDAQSHGARSYIDLLFNGFFWGGVALYAFTSIAWLWALKTYPLSRAYPVLALTFAIVPISAVIFFGEHLGARDYFGIALILVGVTLIASPL